MHYLEALTIVTALFISNAPLLVGFILPPLVEVINKGVVNTRFKFVMTITICLVAGLLLHLEELSVNTIDDVLIVASVIFAESQMVYKLYFKNSYWQVKLQERFTQEPELVIPKRLEGRLT